MSPRSQDEITFPRLQRFLIDVGFEQPVKIDDAMAFQHAESGTLIMLDIPENGKSVRSADLLSILVRLENEGLASPAVLEQFRGGKLPLPS